MRPVILLYFALVMGAICSAAVCPSSSRDSASFDNGGDFNLGHYLESSKEAEAARSFLWNHWNGGRRGMLSIRTATVEGRRVTFQYYVEPDDSGRWGIFVAMSRMDSQNASEMECIEYRVYKVEQIFVDEQGQPKKGGKSFRLILKDEKGEVRSAI